MPNNSADDHGTSIGAALSAHRRGYQAVPILNGEKRPRGSQWQHTNWTGEDQVRKAFADARENGAEGIGLLLGKPSGGLVDIDLDHPKALRLRDHLLPPSPMQTGRDGRSRSHRWYRVEDHLPESRRYKMTDGRMSVELRSTGDQTVIPPTVHPSGEAYRWEGEPWGGDHGPAKIDGRKLSVQVALLALGSILLDHWPKRGSRHETYLALAGGLLRYGEDVHPYWERNLPILISALADATNDEDGAEVRVHETMGTTLTRIREGGQATGFPRLSEIVGDETVELIRRRSRDVEALSGFVGQDHSAPLIISDDDDDQVIAVVGRDPMSERLSSWSSVDLEPYLTGEVVRPDPTVLIRSDGVGLMYPGRVNSLFGKSESAKTFCALYACMQEMGRGDRVLYVDFEDMPEGTLERLRSLGADPEDLKHQFRYVAPEGPLAEMQRYRNGPKPTKDGKVSSEIFRALLDSYDPTLIVADGMTTLYGLHGHDTNEATATEVITGWLKRLCRGGRSTVIVIDHTGKNGDSPIGAHHKIAMVQGTAIRVDVIDRPMRGAVGRMDFVVYKDRPGAVRAISSRDDEQIAARVTLDSTDPERSTMTIDPPSPQVVSGRADLADRMAELSAAMERSKIILDMFGGDLDLELTSRQVKDSTGWSTTQIYDVWQALLVSGEVVRSGLVKAPGRGRPQTAYKLRGAQ